MNIVIKTTCVFAIAVASFATFSAFNSEKKASTATNPPAPYTITLIASNELINGLYCWTWQITNPNPGNGSEGTLQDISHWSVPFNPATEAALVAASYSYNGTTFISTSPVMDRDPSIKACTGSDVLKFDIGTSGTMPTYYRVCLNQAFTTNPLSVSFIKTGGGQQGCNSYLFAGTGAPL
jgi:hypothetical protein